MLAVAFPIVVLVTLLEYRIIATGRLVILILLIGTLDQHYFVPLVVQDVQISELSMTAIE